MGRLRGAYTLAWNDRLPLLPPPPPAPFHPPSIRQKYRLKGPPRSQLPMMFPHGYPRAFACFRRYLDDFDFPPPFFFRLLLPPFLLLSFSPRTCSYPTTEPLLPPSPAGEKASSRRWMIATREIDERGGGRGEGRGRRGARIEKAIVRETLA